MTAPVLIVCFSDRPAYLKRYAQPDKAFSALAGHTDDWAIPYWHVDTGMAVMSMLLTAEDLGLGACFFAVPASRWPALFEAFDVPAGLTPVGVVSMGHPAVDHRSRSSRQGRQTRDDAVSYRSFGSSPTG